MRAALLLPALAAFAVVSQDDAPETTPERTKYERTSTTAEVHAFVESLMGLSHGARLSTAEIGRTEEDRPLLLVTVADPRPASEEALLADERVRVFVNANIHGGEVEGKEAVQMLLREFALGEHADVLEHAIVFFLPVYNADGNDRIARTNRVSQNGPDGGVGERANANDLDLNRDFMKVESAEARALVSVLDRLDPHLFMDLHTTNGSDHGYHLTYAPSLAPGLDEDLERFARETMLPAIRHATEAEHGFRTFDYGNLPRRRSEDEPPTWSTYDHRPRFGTNMVGLRNRFSILSEAYSYSAYPERIASTRAFVLESLRFAAKNAGRMRAICRAADGRSGNEWLLPVDGELAPGTPFTLLLQRVDTVEVDVGGERPGRRRVASGELSEVEALARIAFVASREVELPSDEGACWLAPATIADELRTHGVRFGVLAEDVEREVDAFTLSGAPRARRPFQGHLERSFEGRWLRRRLTFPAGTLVVPRDQPLFRLAAWLLEPESDDSLGTWNTFDVGVDAALADGGDKLFPVQRLASGGGELPLR